MAIMLTSSLPGVIARPMGYLLRTWAFKREMIRGFEEMSGKYKWIDIE